MCFSRPMPRMWWSMLGSSGGGLGPLIMSLSGRGGIWEPGRKAFLAKGGWAIRGRMHCTGA